MRFELAPMTDAESLLAEWRALYALAPSKSFFLSPAWMTTWLAGAPARGKLQVLRGFLGERLMLLAVIASTGRRPPLVGPRCAHLHEFGKEALDAVYIEDNDFLIGPDAPDDVRTRALAALADALTDADEVVLRNVRPSLGLAVNELCNVGEWELRCVWTQPTYAVNLDMLRKLGCDYLSSRSSGLRAKVRRAGRLYGIRGKIRVGLAQTVEERARAWRELINLHQEGWRRRGEAGAFANLALTAFHERFMAANPDRCHLFTVDVGGAPLGRLYNFIDGGRVLNYQGGFSFEDDNRLAPGLLTHALAAQYYLEQGFDSYDLLVGEAEYKRRLADQSGVLSTIVLARRNIRARLRDSLRRARALA